MTRKTWLLPAAALAFGLACAGCHDASAPQSGNAPPPPGTAAVPGNPAPPNAAAAAAQANGAGLGARNHPGAGTP